MIREAILSDDGVYRYHLRRQWAQPDDGSDSDALLFVMLNPSVASATVDDPTVRRCHGFAHRLGFFAFEVVNLFAYRATDPSELSKRLLVDRFDIEGPDNDAQIQRAAADASRVVVAWGAPGGIFAARVARVVQLLKSAGRDLYCMGTTKDGSPRHPLMLPYSAQLQHWSLP